MNSIDNNVGVTLVGAEAHSNYHVAARSEKPTQVVAGVPPAAAVVASPTTVGVCGSVKKRGRPRKYGPDGALAKSLSQMPINSSAPPQFTPAPPSAVDLSAGKMGMGRTIASEDKQQQKAVSENLVEAVACSAGASLMTHVVTVDSGEDITMKIFSLTNQGTRAICVMSAAGSISNAKLRLPGSSGGGTLTYEGRFDIVHLTGSFIPTAEVGASSVSSSGGLSVTLVSPDGRIIAGVLAGLLIADGPVQVVVGSFLPNGHQEQKPKKVVRIKPNPAPNAPPLGSAAVFPTSGEKDFYAAREHDNSAAAPSPNLNSSYNQAPNPNLDSSYNKPQSWASMETTPDFRKSATDINISLQGA